MKKTENPTNIVEWKDRVHFSEKNIKNDLFLKEISKYIINKETVCEIGSGLGRIQQYLYEKLGEKTPKMDAYEYSSIFVEKSIKLMKEYYPNNKINHLKGNVMDISDIKKRYDVVWSSGLIEHFDNSLLAIENHIKIIRRGGIAIISIPTADSPDYYLKYIYTQPLITKYIDSDYKDRHHYGRRMTICEMESLCNQLNLKIIKKIQYGNSYRYPFELLKIVKEMLKKYKKINKRDIINIFSILLLIPVGIITNIFNIKGNSLYFVLEKN